MNIWFVIYVGTAIGGTVGPLPDMKECQYQATLANVRLLTQIATGHDINGQPIDPMSRLLRFTCEMAADRPPNTFGQGPTL